MNPAPEQAGFSGDLADEDATQRVGQSWAASRGSLGLLVPSLVVPIEFNVLVKPLHGGYSLLVWHEPRPFRFDPRLLKKSAEAG